MDSKNISVGSNHDSTTETSSSSSSSSSPLEFENRQKTYQEIIAKLPHQKSWRENYRFIKYGGHWWPQLTLQGTLHALKVFKAQPSHFFICSSPKTGTTWLKALTFAITNRSKFQDSSNPLLKRNPHDCVPYMDMDILFSPDMDVLKNQGNTLFSTHIPYHLLPESIVESNCKMVYIWRDPKDTFVSMWTFTRKLRQEGDLISLEEAFDKYCQGLSMFGPYFDHVLGYWKAYKANPDRILFLKYETMRADPLPYVKSLAEFMGYGFTEEEDEERVAEKVVKLCSFENLKNLEVNKGDLSDDRKGSLNAVYDNSYFFRKGEVGDWHNYLTPKMAARIDGLMEEKFKGTTFLSP